MVIFGIVEMVVKEEEKKVWYERMKLSLSLSKGRKVSLILAPFIFL
jgi:hypothetical protein